MAPKRKTQPKRVEEIENEIADALARVGEASRAIIDHLQQIDSLGIGRSQYNLGNPYNRGHAHAREREDSEARK